MVHSLTRLWYRATTREIYPTQVREGDRLLMDFPGTGPYLSAPLHKAGEWSPGVGAEWMPGVGVAPQVWFTFGNGVALSVPYTTTVRVRRS